MASLNPFRVRGVGLEHWTVATLSRNFVGESMPESPPIACSTSTTQIYLPISRPRRPIFTSPLPEPSNASRNPASLPQPLPCSYGSTRLSDFIGAIRYGPHSD